MNDAQKIEQLITDLRNPDWQIRHNAADQLKNLQDPHAVEPLIRALNDESLTVRIVAAMTLGILKDERAIMPLITLLKTNTDHDVLFSAGWAVAEIGTAAYAHTVDLLLSGNPLGSDVAADILGHLQDARAIAPLTQALAERGISDYPQTGRFGAADALERFGEAAIPSFVAALAHPIGEIRARAVQALGSLKAEGAVAQLIPLLNDNAIPFRAQQDRYRVCDATADALEEIGTPEALAAVQQWRGSSA